MCYYTAVNSKGQNERMVKMRNTKKIISLIVCAALALSMFSVTAVNAGAANTKTQALIDRINSTKEVCVTLTAGNTALGSSTDTIAIKGNAVAYDYNTGFLKTRIVVRDNTAYAYLPILPIFYVQVNSLGLTQVDVWKLVERASGVTFAVLNYVKSYTEELYGVTYYVEEYNDRAQVTSKFCYIGDELKLLNVNDARTNSVQNTYFESISFTVPDSMVAVPTGFDLTPYLKGLFTALLVGAIL